MSSDSPQKRYSYYNVLNDSQVSLNPNSNPQKDFRLDIEERYNNKFDINCVEYDSDAVKFEICFKTLNNESSNLSAMAHIDNADYSEVIKDVLNRAMEMVYCNFIIDHKS